MNVGDPELVIPLSATSAWTGESFRVWGDRPYRLHLASVNHTPPFGNRFRGAFEVRLLDPSGTLAFHRIYEGNTLVHGRPDNMEWSELASLELRGSPWRAWMLEARTIRADTAFHAVHSTLTLRRVRDDPGMGGLINYVMPIPGFILMMVSLLPAAWLGRRGTRAPLRISATALILLILALGTGLMR